MAALNLLPPTADRCWTCGDFVGEGESCQSCLPAVQAVPSDRSADPYSRDTVWQMFQTLREHGGLETVDTEIAALTAEAKRLLDMQDVNAVARGMTETDLAAAVRQCLATVVAAKEKRQKLIMDQGYAITVDMVRGLFQEFERILRRVIRDEATLAEIGYQMASIQLRFRRHARPS